MAIDDDRSNTLRCIGITFAHFCRPIKRARARRNSQCHLSRVASLLAQRSLLERWFHVRNRYSVQVDFTVSVLAPPREHRSCLARFCLEGLRDRRNGATRRQGGVRLASRVPAGVEYLHAVFQSIHWSAYKCGRQHVGCLGRSGQDGYTKNRGTGVSCRGGESAADRNAHRPARVEAIGRLSSRRPMKQDLVPHPLSAQGRDNPRQIE